MKSWKLCYKFYSRFSARVTDNYFTLRCFPYSSDLQRVDSFRCDIDPCTWKSRSQDSFGNKMLVGAALSPHESFRMTMDAVVSMRDGLWSESGDISQLGMYRMPTHLTSAGSGLKCFYQSQGLSLDETKSSAAQDMGFLKGSVPGMDPWELSLKLMDAIYGEFTYKKQVTDVTTTAEEAWEQKEGVCQDLSHILISLGRLSGLTVRYVAGAIPGEGLSHAWVEVYRDGFWKGFDPTHNKETDAGYIVFARGRDASDCVLNRGIYVGGHETMQETLIIMEEA